ncbi:MAG: hypothetical protein M3Y48_10690 [Actinomycetota bacterium]|nr:hypothetical protein [Actinomycetota bacterium]
MRRWGAITVGTACVLLGGLFFLQGIGVVGGSTMTGERLWVFIGLVMLLAGLAVLITGVRGRDRRS